MGFKKLFLAFFKQQIKEISIDMFKKGYFKGVLDSEYGQITSEELLSKLEQRKKAGIK